MMTDHGIESELRLAHGNLLAKDGYYARRFSFRPVSNGGKLTRVAPATQKTSDQRLNRLHRAPPSLLNHVQEFGLHKRCH